jgi:hypothetical protein
MKIIMTSALISDQFENRKQDYIESYESLIKFIDPKNIFLLECFSSKEHFLENYSKNIYYSNTHNTTFKNKGVLEILCMKKFLQNNTFDDEELLLKITGRYKLLNSNLFNIINEHPTYDFYGKKIEKQIFCGCYIIKTKILYQFLSEADLDHLETTMTNIEKYLFNFLQRKSIKSFFIPELSVNCKIFGDGNTQEINI